MVFCDNCGKDKLKTYLTTRTGFFVCSQECYNEIRKEELESNKSD